MNYIIVTLVGGISGVISNALVVLITWLHTFKNTREAVQLGMRASLSETLLRDGQSHLSTIKGDYQ